MTESKLIFLGKTAYVFSQIYRWLVILLLMTLIGVGSAGIGMLWAVLIVEGLKRAISFNTSCYKEFEAYINKELEALRLIEKIKQKQIFNSIVLVVLVVIYLIFQFVDGISDTLINIILFTPFFGMVLFQMWHCKVTAYFIQMNYKLNNHKIKV